MTARRRIYNLLFRVAAVAATAALVAAMVSIVWVIAARGYKAINWELLTKLPEGGGYMEGSGGGVANAIVGSLYIGVGATVIALLIGLPTALYLRVFAGKWFAIVCRTCLDVLWGVPSIVFGAFGFTLMVIFGWRASLLAGMITVSLFELPIIIRSIDEAIRMSPRELEETSYSLGATRSETATRVVLRQAIPGIITGALLAFGRGVGDAASVLFTAGFTDRFPRNISDPVATLPLSIFFQLGTPFEEAHQRAYGAALLLVLLVLGTSVLSRIAGAFLGRYTVK